MPPSPHPIHIGCAGWSIRSDQTGLFPSQGSHLGRYAERFGAVEINSSFYRPHRPQTYARWAATTPAAFRFAVKVPKAITHERRLADTASLLDGFLGQVTALGDKLGPLLVQLPPRAAFDPAVAARFFADLRARHGGPVVCEPRHPTWFSPEADALLVAARVGRVAADPAPVPAAASPGGWEGSVYHRLHGSPHMYYSAYDADFLAALASRIAAAADRGPVWCVFDNTARGAATTDARALRLLLAERSAERPAPGLTPPG